MTAILPPLYKFNLPSSTTDALNGLTILVNGLILNVTYNVVSNAVGQTITAAQIIAGYYEAQTRGAGTTDTTDTAAAIVTALAAALQMTAAQVQGLAFKFRYLNSSTNSVTIAGGTNVTPSGAGATAVAAGVWQEYLLTIGGNTTTPTITMVSIGKGTFA